MDKRGPLAKHSAVTKKTENVLNKSCQCSEEKLSIISIVCRICYDNNKDEPIITPCRCKGTVAFIHRSCLETWLAESNTTKCELCHYVYGTERTPRFTAQQSIWHWISHQPRNLGFQVRGLRSDLFACSLLTPLAIIITYVCLFSADYYNQQKFASIPAARWTSLSLLIMISIMLVGYYLWVYMVIRYHARVWYYWWQRECVVRYIPPSAVNIVCEHDTVNVESNNEIQNGSSHETLDQMDIEINEEETNEGNDTGGTFETSEGMYDVRNDTLDDQTGIEINEETNEGNDSRNETVDQIGVEINEETNEHNNNTGSTLESEVVNIGDVDHIEGNNSKDK